MKDFKTGLDAYMDTVARMEPDIAFIDSSAGWASIAISLKRIADSLESIAAKPKPQSGLSADDIYAMSRR